MSTRVLLVTVLMGLIALIALPGCQPPTATDSTENAPAAPAKKAGTELAKVGDSVITVEEFEARLDKIPPFYKKTLSTPEGKKDFLDRMVMEEIYYLEGLRRGMDRESEFLEQMEAIKKNILASKIKKEILERDVTPTDEEIRQYYEENKSEFTTPEQRKVRHILVKISRKATEEEIAKAKAKADKALAAIKGGANFAGVAEEYSEDKNSAKKGGEIPPVRKGVKSKEFDDAVWGLKAGQVSDVFKDRRGFNIVKLEEAVEETFKEFDKVEQQIKRKLENEQRKQVLDNYNEELKGRTNVVVHEELLAEIGPQPETDDVAKDMESPEDEGEPEPPAAPEAH